MLRLTRENLVWGTTFLLLQVLIIVRNLVTDYFVFYWYCDFAPTVFAVFFFLNAPQTIKGMLNIGLFGQFLYTCSFISALLFGLPLFGFPIDFKVSTFNTITTLIMHQSALIAYFATRRVEPTYRSLLASLGILGTLYVTVLSTTEPTEAIDHNYNYIYFAEPFASLPYYTQLWIFVAFFVVVVPSYAIQKLPYIFNRHPIHFHQRHALTHT